MTTLNLQGKALLIDLDGTMYHGEKPVPHANVFIKQLKEKNIPFRFVTNNSSATPEDVAMKLTRIGIAADTTEVCTSAQATAHYIGLQSPNAKAYVIGEYGLQQALTDAGIEMTDHNPDFVVQGIDRELTYAKVMQAVTFIRNGARSILTNPDLLLPSTNGLIPGAGSIGAMIEQASGQKPIIIGKPSQILIQYALDQLQVNHTDAIVIGDNLATDIAAGVQSNCDTILLMTGLTTRDNYSYYKEQAGCEPKYIFDSIEQLINECLSF